MKAMQKLLNTMPIIAIKFNGTSFDCQTKAGYVAANLSFAIEHDSIKEELIINLFAQDCGYALIIY